MAFMQCIETTFGSEFDDVDLSILVPQTKDRKLILAFKNLGALFAYNFFNQTGPKFLYSKIRKTMKI